MRASLTPPWRNPPPTEPILLNPPPTEPTLLSSSVSTSSTAPTKTIREYSSPTISNVATGPDVVREKGDFELKPALITMVQASPFYGKRSEDANAHLQNFLEICNTISIEGVPQDTIRLQLFPFHCLKRRSIGFIPTREP